MVEHDLSGPDEVRRDARRALQDGALSSAKDALKLAGGVGAACGLVGGGVIALQQFNAVWLVGLVSISVLSGAAGYAILEIARLRRQSALLSRVLESEKYYESLVRTAEERRRVAEDTARSVQTRLDVLIGTRDLLTQLTAPSQGNDEEQ